MERKKSVDAFIEPLKANGVIEDYKMYIHYNGIEPCFLHSFPETSAFASYFKRKMHGQTNEMCFSDDYGWRKPKEDFNSILYTITGIDNIKSSIGILAGTCENLDIQSDFTVHLHELCYPLVRDVDNKNYLSSDALNYSKKGTNTDVFIELQNELSNLKHYEKNSLIKKRR